MRSIPVRPAVLTALVALSLMLGACASSQPQADENEAYEVNDPLETVNRGIFTFNIAADDYVIKPTATAYRDYVPEAVRNSIQAFLNNLRSPVILANDALQGQGKLAGDTFARMIINTVLGVGGVMDVATDLGIPYHDADFGQTFGVWGVPAGPYLVLPLLGPSDSRDAVGLAAGTLGDPMNGYLNTQGTAGSAAIAGRSVTSGIDTRSRNIELLDRIRSTSLDYYATLRSLYLQRRDALVRHEAPPSAAPGLTN